jgi:hypothetical protein
MPAILAIMGPVEWLLIIGAVAVFAIIAQRDYQRYKLEKAAVEKGLTVLPTGAPLWLASLKKGFLVLALGAGLVTMGGIGLATLPDPAKAPLPQGPQNPPLPPPGAGPATTPAAQTQTKPQPQDQNPPPPINQNFQNPPGGGPRGGIGGGPGGGIGGPGGMPRMNAEGLFVDFEGRPLPPEEQRRLQQMRSMRQDGIPPMDGQRPQGGPQNPPPHLAQPPEAKNPAGPRPFDPRQEAIEGRRMCYYAIGAGGVIGIIGLVLVIFSMLERKYVSSASNTK